ncbi:catalase [[Brevibacterium] frigoritolerans]|uniref:catalase n=1 Tax=Peribacillus frigoritolerans TaxID=450367 RepID=A0A941FQF8_9BACI|nr:catalase [Peribacillus frigoritolerans]
MLVKYHWELKQGIKNLTQQEANEIQATNFNHATQDLYEAIERGDYPEWDLNVQIMSDDDHPELISIRWMIRKSGRKMSSHGCMSVRWY